MKRLTISEQLLSENLLPESGMDYCLALVESDDYSGPLVIRGNGNAAPLEEHDRFYSISQAIAGTPLPAKADTVTLSHGRLSRLDSPTRAGLPPGYLPATGALPLLGTVQLTQATHFFRLTSSASDLRYDSYSGELAADTYLTSQNDFRLVNTGFGAVGRYALPLPLPASYVHVYTIPAGTTLSVGTVEPLFGQSGGGVELKTTAAISGVVCHQPMSVDDF